MNNKLETYLEMKADSQFKIIQDVSKNEYDFAYIDLDDGSLGFDGKCSLAREGVGAFIEWLSSWYCGPREIHPKTELRILREFATKISCMNHREYCPLAFGGGEISSQCNCIVGEATDALKLTQKP